MIKKKRKAERIYEDYKEREMLLPARKTKDIADKHLAEAKEKPLKERIPISR